MSRAAAGPLLLAAGAGIAIFASQPPLGWWPLVFLAPPLLLVAVLRRVGPAWVLGLVAGLAAYLPMLVWLIRPAGLLAWGLLAVVQALFLAATATLVAPFVSSRWVVAMAPLVWTGLDAWRNVVPLGGFGWGSLGYAHVEGSWMLPVARVLGQHGLTLFTVLIGALVHDLVRTGLQGDGQARRGFARLQPTFVGLLAALLLSVAVTVEPPPPSGALDTLAVQGNDDSAGVGMGAAEDLRIAANMLDLTRRAVAAEGPPELTVWPESSVDRDPYTQAGSQLLPLVERAAKVTEGGLLIGVNRDGPRSGTWHNTALLLDREAEPVDSYVKRHPVPFGEYVPARSLLGDLGPLRQIPRDAVPGEGPQPLEVDGTHIATVICFESLFPDLVRDNVRAGHAEIIVVTTNDASYGVSAEPAQHLAQSQLRAVETGRWVVHGALSGASAFVDPNGRVHQRTELFELATIRRDVPLVSGATPFLAAGDVVGLGSRFAVLAVIVALVLDRRRRSSSSSPPSFSPSSPSSSEGGNT